MATIAGATAASQERRDLMCADLYMLRSRQPSNLFMECLLIHSEYVVNTCLDLKGRVARSATRRLDDMAQQDKLDSGTGFWTKHCILCVCMIYRVYSATMKVAIRQTRQAEAGGYISTAM